jgi:hypothetical protein
MHKKRYQLGLDQMTRKVFITAHIPPELEKAWLQHVRDFDVAHEGCHFDIAMDAPEMSLKEMINKLQVDPALNFTQLFERKI